MNTITMRVLGRMGRWGNQLFQYATLSTIADELGCEFQCPPWLGESVFGLENHPITSLLPRHKETYDANENPTTPDIKDFVNTDAYGYFQYHTSFWTEKRRVVWSHRLQPCPVWRDRMMPAYIAFHQRGKTHVCIHIRRGDYGGGNCFDAITPVKWYLNWLADNWSKLDVPVLFVASEDAELVSAFNAYLPQTVTTLGIELQPAPYLFYNYESSDLESRKAHLLDFLPEWFMLAQADILLAANSTFSFTAALCGNPTLYRPSFKEHCFTKDDLWNCWPLRKDCKS